MHKLILDGARKIFLKNGYDRTSMRNIADEINYSPGTLYFHFKDKGEIFHELHEEGFRLLITQMKVLDHVADPFERLKALGSVIIDFARNNKDFYDLMFIVDEPSKNESTKDWSMGVAAVNLLVDVILECQQKGRFAGMDIDYLSFMILSAIHGVCALFCKDRTTNFSSKTNEQLMKHGYEYFILMLTKI